MSPVRMQRILSFIEACSVPDAGLGILDILAHFLFTSMLGDRDSFISILHMRK